MLYKDNILDLPFDFQYEQYKFDNQNEFIDLGQTNNNKFLFKNLPRPIMKRSISFEIN